MEQWIRTKDGPAHLVRVRRPWYIATACKLIIPAQASIPVRTEKVGIALTPKFYFRPQHDPVCEICDKIEKEST